MKLISAIEPSYRNIDCTATIVLQSARVSSSPALELSLFATTTLPAL